MRQNLKRVEVLILDREPQCRLSMRSTPIQRKNESVAGRENAQLWDMESSRRLKRSAVGWLACGRQKKKATPFGVASVSVRAGAYQRDSRR